MNEQANAEKLAPQFPREALRSNSGPGRLIGINQTIASLAWSLESLLGKPVLDETALTNHYDSELKWTDAGDTHPDPGSLVQAVREQLGLELKAETPPVEVLLVEKTAMQRE